MFLLNKPDKLGLFDVTDDDMDADDEVLGSEMRLRFFTRCHPCG